MKRYKVRHYRSRIYNPIRGKIIKGALIAVIVLSIFAIGWFAYEPIMEAVNEKNKEIIEEEPVPEKLQEPAYEPLPEEFLDKETAAVVIPEEVLYDPLTYYSFLKNLGDEVTAVIIDMKTQNGTVTYSSNHVSVINAGAIHEQAANLETCIKTAKNFGYDVVARIYAFEDSTAPYNAVDMAIRYESADGILWLDDSVDNGGKPWLNPYSDTAQKYVLDIIYDAIDSGVDAILLEGVRFPENEGMDYAYFGVGAEKTTKGEILKQFSQRIYSAAVVTDTDIIIGFEALAVAEGSDIYGESPFGLSADGYAPNIDIDDFIGTKFSEEFYFKKMPEDITEVFVKIYESLGSVGGLRILPVLDVEGFMKEDMQGIFDYLEVKGTVGYAAVYNEAYFTGILEEPEVLPEEETSSKPQAPSQPSVTPPAQSSVPETPSQSSSEQNTSSGENTSSSETSSENKPNEDGVSVSISGRDY